jgi:CO/xanthine dehydrogenase Mo-binding subunit
MRWLIETAVECQHDRAQPPIRARSDARTPAGVKGLGELANVGTAAAIASAVYHATGIRVRELPIRIEKLLDV